MQRTLVLQLVSLLWRLRRTTTMETGLFEIQADYLRELWQSHQTQPQSQEIIQAKFGLDKWSIVRCIDNVNTSMPRCILTVDECGDVSTSPTQR
jgi:hypothetical protein